MVSQLDFADGTVLVAVPLGIAHVDSAGVEATDLVAVVVGLEEETSAPVRILAMILAVGHGLDLDEVCVVCVERKG